MNYCILNGKKSTMVKGLMIQSLPSIIKPKIRTRIEEIDGRDGDLVTQLGYSAYDKEMSIGLFGDFDMAEVAAYFDQSGEVIFSNELDKKYNFQILDQINYERLGQFKQAVIKFHVQPFKYSSTEDKIILNPNYSENFTEYIFNNGNIYSRPKLTVERNSTSLNDINIYFVEYEEGVSPSLSDAHQITWKKDTASNHQKIEIDLDNMTAHYPNDSNVLANRNVSGDYSKMVLAPGRNAIVALNGAVPTTQVRMTMENLTRWI